MSDLGRGHRTKQLQARSRIAEILEKAGADEVVGGPPAVCLRGSTEQIAEKLAAYAALGIQHFTFWLYPLRMKGIERLAPIVEAAHKL